MRKGFIFGGIVVLIVMIAGVFAYSQNTTTRTNSENGIITPVPTSSIQEGEENQGTATLPEGWQRGYDGAFKYGFAYPSGWIFTPPTTKMSESAFYSFDPKTQAGRGGISTSEIKIAVMLFPPEDPRGIDYGTVEEEREIIVDGRQATRRVTSGGGGGSITTTVETDEGIYLISAYPPDSELIAAYDEFLNHVSFSSDPQVTIESPDLFGQISSPVTIEGKAPGNWFFEGVLPIELRTTDGELITQVSSTSTQDWMTTESIPFSATVDFEKQGANSGVFVINKANPSGLPGNAYSYYWPVTF